MSTSANANARLQIRHALLSAIAEAAAIGLPFDTLSGQARTAGYPLADGALSAHLEYLRGKGLIREGRSALSAGLKRWYITAAGTDYLEGEGL